MKTFFKKIRAEDNNHMQQRSRIGPTCRKLLKHLMVNILTKMNLLGTISITNKILKKNIHRNFINHKKPQRFLVVRRRTTLNNPCFETCPPLYQVSSNLNWKTKNIVLPRKSLLYADQNPLYRHSV